MNTSRKPLRVFVSEKIVIMKAYTGESPLSDADVPMEEILPTEIQKTRWLVACIVSFLIGAIVGLAAYDHIVTANSNGPVWKMSPYSSSGQTRPH